MKDRKGHNLPLARLWLMILLLTLSACQASSPAVPRNTPTVSPLLKEKTSIVESIPTQPPQKTLTIASRTTTEPEKTMSPTVASSDESAFEINKRLGRGINLGNALEAPTEGEWGVTLQAEYFRLIKEQGFQSVRVPIRWSAHAAAEAPYRIDPAFFERVDWAVEQALQNDLSVIINIHHYGEMFAAPAGQRERFLALWEQIAAHYQDAPESVLFELLNEPNGSAMTAEVWNGLAAAALEKVRQTNPNRYIIIGPVNWNSLDALDTLVLPEDDRRIIGTFHYYQPFQFTHQGAEWTPGADQWLGTKWEGTAEQKDAIARDLDFAARWSEKHNRPVLMGEFGAYNKADMDSRARWTAAVARAAETRGFSWTYWEFCAGFGIYAPEQHVFRTPLLQALIPAE